MPGRPVANTTTPKLIATSQLISSSCAPKQNPSNSPAPSAPSDKSTATSTICPTLSGTTLKPSTYCAQKTPRCCSPTLCAISETSSSKPPKPTSAKPSTYTASTPKPTNSTSPTPSAASPLSNTTRLSGKRHAPSTRNSTSTPA